MSRSDSKTIYRAELRGNSGKESVLNLGQQYPILQSSFLSGPTQQPGSSVFFPQVDFKQIGFEVKAKPVVWRDTVTMDLSLNVSLLTGESSNGIPVLSNRETTTRLQVENGQMISVAGLLLREEARSLSGLAGLGQLPGIGALFRQTSNTKEETEVLIVIRPRVLHSRTSRMASPGWWTGTSTRFLAPL
ncbi:MAG: type II and III secretion system protein [Bryobacterales bacterium]|nr:type II and III secretion system protein [Bryobacterales bacterium]